MVIFAKPLSAFRVDLDKSAKIVAGYGSNDFRKPTHLKL